MEWSEQDLEGDKAMAQLKFRQVGGVNLLAYCPAREDEGDMLYLFSNNHIGNHMASTSPGW